MIDLSFMRGQTVMTLGLGASGIGAARALAQSGVGVVVWDDNADRRAAAEAEGLSVAAPSVDLLATLNAMVLSPGIPRSRPAPHPGVTAAIEAGCPIVSDIDLLARAVPNARFIGITGTNGKSTTTALTGRLLDAAGVPMAMGGNLGPAALTLEHLPDGGWYVLELSSYQLETIREVEWSIAVLLNLSPDHLDRYNGFEDYAATKESIFSRLKPDATAVIGCDDAPSRQIAERLRQRGTCKVVSISASPASGPSTEADVRPDIWADRGWLHDATDPPARAIVDLATCPTLPGRHNHQNACAAYAICRAVGVPAATIASALAGFPGLAHRQELVARHKGVSFVNDSKATNPEAAAKALSSYPAIYWIAGGLPKPGGFAAIVPHLAAVRGAFVFGTAAAELQAALAGRRFPVTRCETLEEAARLADAAAREAVSDGVIDEAVVLLSPGCASFDQFSNFEERGNTFRTLAVTLTGGTEPTGKGGHA